MAEEFGQSRTEAPTPRRRQDAREEGKVAFSSDLSSGLVLLAGMVALTVAAAGIGGKFLTFLRFDLLHCWVGDISAERAQGLFVSQFGRGMALVGFFWALVFFVGLAVGVFQAGVHLVPSLVSMNWGRLAPAAGWSRVFSISGSFRGLVALLKVALVSGVIFWVIRGRSMQISGLTDAGLLTSARQAWGMTVHLALAIAGALVLLGVVDYLFQRWRLEQSLRMTRQELKEEIKREEGNPQMKARIRKLQREAAKKSMMADVPRATVVVTNPTHLAIALSYERGSMAAPRVLAKGAGFVALRIVELARRHAVPVLERKPLAQALYKSVEIGQDIPAALYYVVAELFAYVYRLRGWNRPTEPGTLAVGQTRR